MIKRPTKTDSENEILQMQHDYFEEQKKNKSFEPAAKFFRMKREGEGNNDEPKQSEFAKRRNLRKVAEGKAEKPSLEHAVIGEIVEKIYGDTHRSIVNVSSQEIVERGFPNVELISIPTTSKQESMDQEIPKKKSLFAQMVTKKKTENIENHSKVLPTQSHILEQSDEAMQIHEENIEKLRQMSQKEILKERENIMQTMDPKLIEFLKSRKNVIKPEIPKSNVENKGQILETNLDLDVLNEQGAQNWLHFDVLEPEKLEWTKNIQASMKKLKPGEKFEARFDWKGVLLPYVDKNADKDERELYLHGEEAERPGYTLQELFRLARSNVLQQRISALNSIAGILNIYSQGFYDGILELPISKIFFFLRFALDENTPAIVEVAARSLAYLFHNDTDETMLDTIFETNFGIFQPELGLNLFESKQENQNTNLERKFANMNFSKSTKKQVRFEAEVDNDDEINRESMNDFHMAETDLMEVLMRTNILERIRYILFTIRPESSTLMSCVKILIRMARNNEEFSMKIIQNEFLMKNLMKYYLTSIDGYGGIEPQYIVIKLLRILCAQNANFYKQHLAKLNLLDYLRGYVFTRKDINVKMIQIQIETFRLLRILLTFANDDQLYRELLPALTYLLDWHYEYLIYDDTGPYLVRQHCAALILLISCNPQEVNQQLAEKLFACSSKWFTYATKHGAGEFSQKILLAACLDAAKKYEGKLPGAIHNFYENYFLSFMNSAKFNELTKCLSSSPLFKHDFHDCSQRIAPLPNLGGIITKENHSGEPTLIITKSYPTFLLHCMLQFVKGSEERLSGSILHNKFIEEYLRKLSSINLEYCKLTTNWYLKTELRFVLSILKILKDAELCLKIAFNIISCLTGEFYRDIISLFDDIIFNSKFYGKNDFACRPEDLQRWKFMFKLKVTTDESCGVFKGFVVGSKWKNQLLKKSWPYSLTYAILDKLETGAEKLKNFTEEDIIKTTSLFTELTEINGIQVVTPSEKLMYLMTMFLGPDSKFLDPYVSSLLLRRANALKYEMNGKLFNFDGKMDNGKSFESLYQLVLDIFQSSSYGHSLFSALVMMPLAQQYDVKWRNIIWSEYVAVLRFITCQECELFDPLENYLNPDETDGSLIKLYALALNSNLLRPESIPHRIAQHHLNRRRQIMKLVAS